MSSYALQALEDLAARALDWRHRHAERIQAAEEIRPGVLKDPTSPHRFDFMVCMDCRQPEPMTFVVHDVLWAAAGLTKGVICPKCFEARIGRKLEITDLKVCPANEPIFYGSLIQHP